MNVDDVIARLVRECFITEVRDDVRISNSTLSALERHVSYNWRLPRRAVDELRQLLSSGVLHAPRVPYIYRGQGFQRLKFSRDIDVSIKTWQPLVTTVPQMSWSLSQKVAAGYVTVDALWSVVFRARPTDNVDRLITGVNRLVDAPSQNVDREVLAIDPITTCHVMVKLNRS
jgi:hypothetical protein